MCYSITNTTRSMSNLRQKKINSGIYQKENIKRNLRFKGSFSEILNTPLTSSIIHYKQELQEVLKFPIEIFWNVEARWSWPQKCANISTLPVILSFMKFCVARTFFCRTSPICCSWGSPGGWIKVSFRYLP